MAEAKLPEILFGNIIKKGVYFEQISDKKFKWRNADSS